MSDHVSGHMPNRCPFCNRLIHKLPPISINDLTEHGEKCTYWDTHKAFNELAKKINRELDKIHKRRGIGRLP